jgi:hypothetical protein
LDDDWLKCEPKKYDDNRRDRAPESYMVPVVKRKRVEALTRLKFLSTALPQVKTTEDNQSKSCD